MSQFVYKNLTAAGKITMPLYTVFPFGVAAAYIFGSPDRTNTPSFITARDMMPIEAWGFFFLVVGLIKVSAWITKKKRVMMFALICGMTMSTLWGGFFLFNIFTQPDSSLTAPMVWGFIAIGHLASLESLKKDTK